MDNGSLNNDSYGCNAISVFPDTPPAASCYTDEVTKEDKFNSISSKDNAHLLALQMTSKSLETGCPQNVDCPNTGTVLSEL